MNLDLEYKYSIDSITHKESGIIVRWKTSLNKGSLKHSVIDVPWEYIINDEKEKYEFIIKEYRIYNNTYDPHDLENLKFNETKWLEYSQRKLNLKKSSKRDLDVIGNKLLQMRKENFVSHILEKNFN